MLPIGAFAFSGGGAVDANQVLAITLFQIVPEFFLDFYCTFTEVNNGLAKPHRAAWSLSTGAEDGSWVGDLVKATVLKIFTAGLVVPLVLLASMTN